MSDPFANHSGAELEVHAAQKIKGKVGTLFQAGGDDFVSSSVESLSLTFGGIEGDYHEGPTRKSGGREPWYPRGTVMRNERHLSLLAADEMREIARRMDVPEVKPEWIGANAILDGIENLSRLPPRTLLFFEGGVTLKIDGDNHPCRDAGSRIAAQYPNQEDLDLRFAKVARGLRGLVAWVEKPGLISVGESFEARIPPQWIYKAS